MIRNGPKLEYHWNFLFAPWVHQLYDPYCHGGIQNEPKKVLAQGGILKNGQCGGLDFASVR